MKSLLTAEEVAQELGYADRSAIHRRVYRGDKLLKACRIPGPAHRSWSRARLIEAGFLTAPPAPVAASFVTVPTPAPVQVVATWRVA